MSSILTDVRQSTKAGILVVDDDVSIRNALVDLLGDAGYVVEAVGNGEEAMEAVRRSSVDLVLTDLRLPGIDGIELLRKLETVDSRLLGIVLTGYGTVTHAIRAMKAGAFDFIIKPLDLDAVEVSVQRALEFRQLKEENQRLQSAVREKYRFENLVGDSPAMWAVYELIEKVSETDSPIMITGESGTGKELVAHTIHYNSLRRENYLITVNCGAIPKHLLEGELFGHERGAFTGAVPVRMGRFERASGGTIFLDEVTEMSLALQAKLVRVLQERSFERVGGNQTLHVDSRVIAATNRNLEQAVANKQFRDDLYYRLNVIPVGIPPLRDRVSDIPLLVEYCLAKFKTGKQSAIEGISREAIRLLEQYAWPGNVRELESVLERIVTLKRRGMIEREDIPNNIHRGGWSPSQPDVNNMEDMREILLHETPDLDTGSTWGPDGNIDFSKSVDTYETRLIVEALRRSKWVKSRAAQLLHMNRTTLVEKLKKKGISKPAS